MRGFTLFRFALVALKRSAQLIALLGIFATQAQASLINSDFSAGFDSWSFEVLVFDGVDVSSATGTDFTVFPDNFSLLTTGNGAVLQTTLENNSNEHFGVLLFQDFLLDALTIGQSLWFSVDLSPSFSSATDDFLIAQFRALDGSNEIFDLTGGGSFDISAWAGRDVSLEFGVQDGDFVLSDILEVSNISLGIQTTQVSEPGALALLLAGGVLLIRRRRFVQIMM